MKINFEERMSIIESHSINLNIWYDSSEEIWTKLPEIYSRMPGWIGFHEGIPFWYGKDSDEKFVTASAEPSGLQFSSKMDADEWEFWIENFKRLATDELGFDVGEPEDGYE